MHNTRIHSDRATAVLRGALEDGEHELALGRLDVGPSLSWVPMDGGKDFVLVTDRCLRWTRYLGPSVIDSLRWAQILSYAEGPDAHRWVMQLRHGLTAMTPLPSSSRRSLTEEDRNPPPERAESILEFSRRDTKAAVAIRDRLEELGVEQGPPLSFSRPPRPEPRLLRTSEFPPPGLPDVMTDEEMRRLLGE